MTLGCSKSFVVASHIQAHPPTHPGAYAAGPPTLGYPSRPHPHLQPFPHTHVPTHCRMQQTRQPIVIRGGSSSNAARVQGQARAHILAGPPCAPLWPVRPRPPSVRQAPQPGQGVPVRGSPHSRNSPRRRSLAQAAAQSTWPCGWAAGAAGTQHAMTPRAPSA